MVKTRSQKVQNVKRKVFEIKGHTLTSPEKREFGIKEFTIRLNRINLNAVKFLKVTQRSIGLESTQFKSHKQPTIPLPKTATEPLPKTASPLPKTATEQLPKTAIPLPKRFIAENSLNFQSSSNSMRRQPARIAKSKQSKVSQENDTASSRAKETVAKHRSVVPSKKNNINISIEIGELVLAKQKYSVPWPARIVAVRKKNVDVYFYGDGRVGAVKKEDILNFTDSNEIILTCLNRNIRDYRKGIIEAERIYGIPDHLSITNLL